MELIRDDSVGRWLEELTINPDAFDWDDGNKTKNKKHGIEFEEIESILYQQDFIFAGRITELAHNEWRGLLIGPSNQERLLALIFTRRGNKIRTISCRPVRSNERRRYEKSIQAYS